MHSSEGYRSSQVHSIRIQTDYLPEKMDPDDKNEAGNPVTWNNFMICLSLIPRNKNHKDKKVYETLGMHYSDMKGH